VTRRTSSAGSSCSLYARGNTVSMALGEIMGHCSPLHVGGNCAEPGQPKPEGGLLPMRAGVPRRHRRRACPPGPTPPTRGGNAAMVLPRSWTVYCSPARGGYRVVGLRGGQPQALLPQYTGVPRSTPGPPSTGPPIPPAHGGYAAEAVPGPGLGSLLTLHVGVHHSQRDVFWSSSLNAKLIKDQLLGKNIRPSCGDMPHSSDTSLEIRRQTIGITWPPSL
jgi:hypothetical protein